ncbi:MAG: hypothetical protein IKL10_10700 [Clostridia bacterium]|nr:hypothetical protein [Clostridia bacterium]
MKKEWIISVIMSIMGIVSIVIDEFISPYLTNHSWIKLTIILVSVVFSYHSFFSILTKPKTDVLSQNIQDINNKLGVIKETISYDTLSNIEKMHINNINSKKNEVFIISNSLQESSDSKSGEKILKTIHDNIFKQNTSYYYILPKTSDCESQVNSFVSQLKLLNSKSTKTSKKKGKLYIKYDDTLLNHISAEYFDIVIYVDCDANGEPLYNNAYVGYFCFSEKLENNQYYYSNFKSEKAARIRRSFIKNINDFEDINL